ncbi:MAG TPA: hypothetical protein VEQ62_17920 [Stellaceae bacterium]|jgi:thymidylate synthase ThyX|nr:hypothetical protein [Stellaceae bacterium]
MNLLAWAAFGADIVEIALLGVVIWFGVRAMKLHAGTQQQIRRALHAIVEELRKGRKND